MLKFLNTTTQKLSATVMTGALIGFSGAANATSSEFNTYTQGLSNKVSGGWVNTITNVSLLGGILLVALGVFGVKQHVENPQTPLKNGLAKIGFGGILMALGPVISMAQGTAEGTDSVASGQIAVPTF